MVSRGLVLAAGLLLGAPAQATDVAGIPFQEKIQVDGAELVLNGAGLRKRFFFDVYAIGLYLGARQPDAAQAISAPARKRVQIHMLRDVDAEQFTQALVEGLRANHDDEKYRALEPRVQQLAALMAQVKQARKGMRIALDSTASGTKVLIDGAPAGAPIPGEDFYQALLRIWLGDKPVQDDLKLRLLGKQV